MNNSASNTFLWGGLVEDFDMHFLSFLLGLLAQTMRVCVWILRISTQDAKFQ